MELDYRDKSAMLVLIVTFFSGKRKKVPCINGSIYRPHLVVKGTTEYLGVYFQEGQITGFDMPCRIRGLPIYLGTMDYTPLQAGTEFFIMEGPVVVGEGIVMESFAE